MFEKLHEERRLSFSHWRYRLLHWTFSEDAETPEESNLPQYLYSHYCPLFHLTNFIAIFLWAIILIKVGRVCIDAIWSVVSNIELPQGSSNKSAPTPSRKKDMGRILFTLRYRLKNDETTYTSYDFDDLEVIPIEEAQQIFNDLMEKYRKAKERSDARKENIRKRVLFWVQFSQVFVKWALYLLYVVLGLVATYLAYICFGPILEFIRWILSTDLSTLIPLLIVTAKFSIAFMLVFAVAFVLLKFSLGRKLIDLILVGIMACAPPAELLCKVLFAPFKWFYHGLNLTCEFISVFYEENCPPITIISETEEGLEDV